MRNTQTENTETTWEQQEKIRRENETKQAKEMMNKLLLVVKELNHTVKNKTNDEDIRWNIYVETNGGIFLQAGGYRHNGKIHVSGSYPRTRKGERISPVKYNESELSINISLNKTPQQIAKDIKNRFIPYLNEKMAYVQQQIAISDNYEDTSLKNLEMLKGFGLEEYEKREKKFSLKTDNIWGKISVHGDSVSIDAHSLTSKQAKQVIDLLVSFDKEGK